MKFCFKKILLLITPIFIFATGCSNDYQVSELTISKRSYLTPYIEGAFKNNSNDTCRWAHIEVEISSGGLSFGTSLAVYDIEPGQIKNISWPCSDCKKLSNVDNVKIKVKDIECYK